jgi:hypothetical protein
MNGFETFFHTGILRPANSPKQKRQIKAKSCFRLHPDAQHRENTAGLNGGKFTP